MSNLLDSIQAATKDAMRAKNTQRLGVLRLISSAIKQYEIDSRSEGARTEINDDSIITVLSKMLKQRQDSIEQYEKANRPELAAQEAFEMDVIREFMPKPLSAEELESLIEQSIQTVNAKNAADMGKVLAHLKPLVQGKADMRQVSESVKQKLAQLS